MEGLNRRVLVLTSRVGVSDAVASEVRTALSETGAVFTKPSRRADTALEIAFEGGSPVLAVLRETAATEFVDVNLVPAHNREKRLLIADMDSTIINVECIDELADFAGVQSEVSRITEAAMRGELDFETALVDRVRLLAGITEADLSTCFTERVALNSGARQLVRTMRARGACATLVSGGFTFFSERVAAAADFGQHFANTLLFEDGCLTGEVDGPILGRAAKRDVMMSEMTRLGIGASEVLAVGDGANDIDMVMAAGLGIAYRAKPALKQVAPVHLDWSDLTALLWIQAIPESDWRN